MDEYIFSAVKFDDSVRQVIHTLQDLLKSADGCNAKVYETHAGKQAHAALIGPSEKHKKAQYLFLNIFPASGSLRLCRRWGGGRPKGQTEIHLGSNFSAWEPLKKRLQEWSLDPKQSRQPKPTHEFGDGIALPGGLPETNHSKF